MYKTTKERFVKKKINQIEILKQNVKQNYNK